LIATPEVWLNMRRTGMHVVVHSKAGHNIVLLDPEVAHAFPSENRFAIAG
jgi:hypothetical protein